MKNKKNRIPVTEYDENKRHQKNDMFVLDDRPRRYDEKTGKFVKPGEPGYDELPDRKL